MRCLFYFYHHDEVGCGESLLEIETTGRKMLARKHL